MKRRNPVGASQNRAIAIGSPDKLGYGAKLNAAGTEGGLLSSLVHISSLSNEAKKSILRNTILHRLPFECIVALAASRATLIGSGILPSNVNLLSRTLASSAVVPITRIKTSYPVFSLTISLGPSL